jgi:biopolymer transport protein ExbD
MAEIQQKGGDSGKGGKKRAKKMSTKIDMTPMVDLAFLLLTFFMLTTTFAKPNVLQLQMPAKVKDKEQNTKIKESEAMTVILAPDDKVFYYFGLNSPKDPTVAVPKVEVTDFSANGIRKVLLTRKQQVPKLTILIKAYADGDKHAKYKDMVDILDEMNITDQSRYALVDISKDDVDLIKKQNLL